MPDIKKITSLRLKTGEVYVQIEGSSDLCGEFYVDPDFSEKKNDDIYSDLIIGVYFSDSENKIHKLEGYKSLLRVLERDGVKFDKLSPDEFVSFVSIMKYAMNLKGRLLYSDLLYPLVEEISGINKIHLIPKIQDNILIFYLFWRTLDTPLESTLYRVKLNLVTYEKDIETMYFTDKK